jgi:predicted SprT family Zn-dependent metalloprotease
MHLADALALAEDLVEHHLVVRHGIRGWDVRLDGAKRRAGVCHYRDRVIGLSAPLTRLHDEEAVRDTILHEIAHVIAGPRHHHDPTWRRVALSLGCSGERCVPAGAPEVEAAWLGVCPAGHVVGRHRRPERPSSCRDCARGFDLAHLLTWTHHGRVPVMHPNYEAELAALRQGRRAVLLPVGARVRVTAPAEAAGAHAGTRGRVVKRGRTSYHLRLSDRSVLRVPFAWVERA